MLNFIGTPPDQVQVPFAVSHMPDSNLEQGRLSMSDRRIQQRRSSYIGDRFGIRLRSLRLNRNMSQIEMAESFGIDRSFISDVERGRKSIGLPMLEVLALGFHLTLAELLAGL